MKKFFRNIIVWSVLIIAIGLAVQTAYASIPPGQFENNPFIVEAPVSNSGLSDFALTVKNGVASQVTGVYAEGLMAFPVVQQPGTDAAYVSTVPNTITQFQMASQYHTVGLLAHDYLAGANFQALTPGNDVYLVYGDGSFKAYRVEDIQEYKALSPNDPYSDFIDLSTQKKLSAEQLFYHTYGMGEATLVMQTCLSTGGVPSWGRIFVIARPTATARRNPWEFVSLSNQTQSGSADN